MLLSTEFTERRFLKVPIALLQYALSNKCLPELRMFIALKILSNGAIKVDVTVLEQLRSYLSYDSVKAVRNNVHSLVDRGWINYDPRSGLHFIKSFDTIRRLNLSSSRSAVFIGLNDLKKSTGFKAFSAGAVINNLINSQKRRLWKLEHQRGSSAEDLQSAKSGFYRLANTAFAKILNCSIGQAFNLKKLAHAHGYITLKKNFKSTGVHISQVSNYKRAYPEYSHLIARLNDQIVLKECDLVRGNMTFSRREKL